MAVLRLKGHFLHHVSRTQSWKEDEEEKQEEEERKEEKKKRGR